MVRLTVHHRTLYRYRAPVSFGDHQFQLRPCESFDQRLDGFDLSIDPAPVTLRWRHDPHGNTLGLARFDGVSDRLCFDARMTVTQSLTGLADLAALDAGARRFPPRYAEDELPDLAPFLGGPAEPVVADFVAAMLAARAPIDAVMLLAELAGWVRGALAYNRREERGVQSPAQTLALARGTCRDFAVLFIAACRHLGFAARYVSGYIGGGADSEVPLGGGATHAWAQVYLPHAGWIDFDPTNGLVGNAGLVRVATVRDPAHALPLWGSWFGEAGDSLGMTVTVRVVRTEHDAAAAV